jgi:hypothetical protein
MDKRLRKNQSHFNARLATLTNLREVLNPDGTADSEMVP